MGREQKGGRGEETLPQTGLGADLKWKAKVLSDRRAVKGIVGRGSGESKGTEDSQHRLWSGSQHFQLQVEGEGVLLGQSWASLSS